MCAQRQLLYVSVLAAMVWASPIIRAKPPESFKDAVEFKVPPLPTQEFFQPEVGSGTTAEENPARGESASLSTRAALLFLTGGLSEEVKPNERPSETLEKRWSIRQFFEFAVSLDRAKANHEAGRCTRP